VIIGAYRHVVFFIGAFFVGTHFAPLLPFSCRFLLLSAVAVYPPPVVFVVFFSAFSVVFFSSS
jgi:hypothetical protein